MFWDSVVAGLKVLTYWETYVAGLEYLAIFFIPMIIVGMIMEKNEGAAGVTGCLSMLLMPVLQVAAMAVMILTIAPIIFGFAEDAAWSFPWQLITMAPGAFFKLVGVLVVAAIALTFVPILGRLQSLQTLVLGGIALMFVLGILDSINPGTIKGRVDFIPDFLVFCWANCNWRHYVLGWYDGSSSNCHSHRNGRGRSWAVNHGSNCGNFRLYSCVHVWCLARRTGKGWILKCHLTRHCTRLRILLRFFQKNVPACSAGECGVMHQDY